MAKIIEMTGLDKSYGKVQVLHNVNLSIATGEVVVIIGASGSGMSTLIRCINGLEQFGAGAIVVTALPYRRRPSVGGEFRGNCRTSGAKWGWSSSILTCFRTRPYWKT